MKIETLAKELGEIKQSQDSKARLKESVTLGLDDKVMDALIEIGFEKVQAKGYNSLFYHRAGYLFKINAGCQGCCDYDFEWRYSLLNVDDPKNENNVKWAIRGADRVGQINRRLGPISIFEGVLVGAVAYPILDRLLDEPTSADALLSFGIGYLAIGLSFVTNVCYFDYKCNKTMAKTLADNSYDSIGKVREIFCSRC